MDNQMTITKTIDEKFVLAAIAELEAEDAKSDQRPVLHLNGAGKPKGPTPQAKANVPAPPAPKPAESGKADIEYNIGALNRAYIAALENPNDPKKVAKVAEIAKGLVDQDPSKKWVLDRLASGQWDPLHKPGEKSGVEEKGPQGFDASNTPKFLLAKAIARNGGSYNAAAAQEHARTLNERAKAAKGGDKRRHR